MNRPLSDHDYHLRYRCSPQWRPFLGALAQELSSRIEPDQARALMRRLGVSMARSAPLPAMELLPDLEEAMNGVWSGMNWGWVELNDTDDALKIIHHCAPIEAAFGAGSRHWSPAVLEGAYEQWLRAAGAGDRLRVQQLATDTTSIEPLYVFALAA
ncbi:cellulose biosynthesis protein BcsD [Sphaerotilus sp.]|uniref:cellulose biosynthesis protein BcsD n=1 Tax=Sphaerotilus sp. TaxID=2093942 RepID=UPI0034E24CB8